MRICLSSWIEEIQSQISCQVWLRLTANCKMIEQQLFVYLVGAVMPNSNWWILPLLLTPRLRPWDITVAARLCLLLPIWVVLTLHRECASSKARIDLRHRSGDQINKQIAVEPSCSIVLQLTEMICQYGHINHNESDRGNSDGDISFESPWFWYLQTRNRSAGLLTPSIVKITMWANTIDTIQYVHQFWEDSFEYVWSETHTNSDRVFETSQEFETFIFHNIWTPPFEKSW